MLTNCMNILKNIIAETTFSKPNKVSLIKLKATMELTQFDFGKALSFLKSSLKVTNSRGNILFMEDGKVYCIPKSQYPKGKREEVKLYWDAILREDWRLFQE